MSEMTRRDHYICAALTGILASDRANRLVASAISNADAALAAAGDAEVNHCRDCCCARSWAALGVTDSGGRGIWEHIEEAVAEIARLRAELAKYTGDLTNEQARAAWDLWDGSGSEAEGMKSRDAAIRKVRSGEGS